jgi:hypothetical protein
VSTAYYAVFHAITARAAQVVFPDADDAFRRRIRRWIAHGDIRNVSRWIAQLQGTSSGNPPSHIMALLDPSGGPTHIDAATAAIADGFLELNDKREQADYDHDEVFTRPDTRGHLALARRVVELIEQTDSDEVKRFYGLIALQAKIQAR